MNCRTIPTSKNHILLVDLDMPSRSNVRQDVFNPLALQETMKISKDGFNIANRCFKVISILPSTAMVPFMSSTRKSRFNVS